MAASISLDLRRRVVKAYLEGGETYASIAARFEVGEASVSRWLHRHREFGDACALAHGGGQPRRLSPAQETQLNELVLAHPDWSEHEFGELIRKDWKLEVSDVTVGRAIRCLGYSVKKRLLPLSATAQTSSSVVVTGEVVSEAPPLRVWFLWTKRAQTSR